MSTPVPHRDCVPSPGSVAVHRIPRSGLRVHRRRRIFRKVPRESLLQRNHYASWEFLVRIPKTRSHGNHYLSDSNWRKNPCAEYFGGKPSWMLFCTGNVFRKTVPRLFHLCDIKSKSSKTNNNIKKQWSQTKRQQSKAKVNGKNKKHKTKGHSNKQRQEAKARIPKAKAIVNGDVTKSKSKEKQWTWTGKQKQRSKETKRQI